MTGFIHATTRTVDRGTAAAPRGAIPQLLVLFALVSCGCGGPREGTPPSLRIGYQKWGTCSILKASARLEDSLRSEGCQVEWIEFPSGPPLLEALNAGSIDVGHTGDSPPLFAQSAGVPFVYVAASSASPESSAILVRPQDGIENIEQLRGRRIGLTKGSSAHTLVIRILEAHAIPLSEVQLIYLPPADGRVALAAGSIDAWSIWDPYLSAAEHSGTVRRLIDGRGAVSGREFYLASRAVVESHPERIRTFLRELRGAKEWARSRPDEICSLLAEQTGLPVDVVKSAESRRNRYDTSPLSGELIAEQQGLADRYWELGLLPRRIRVADVVDVRLGEALP